MENIALIYILLYNVLNNMQEVIHMDKCPNCKTEYKEGTKFCRKCGTRFILPQLKCNDCGTINDDDAEFCTECGGKNLVAYIPPKLEDYLDIF